LCGGITLAGCEAACLPGCDLELQLNMQAILVAQNSRLVYQCGKYGLLVAWVVVGAIV
jgi:hypothetical protein